MSKVLRSACAILLGLGLGVAVAPGLTAAAVGDVPTCVPQGDGDDAVFDNADINADGAADLVIGVPSATDSGLADAGVEDVHFLPGPELTNPPPAQRFGEAYLGQTPAAGDRFGASSAITGPVTTFGCSGLAIGAPGAAGGAGRVTLAHGTNSGISPDDTSVLTGPQVGDGFGSAVVATYPYDYSSGADFSDVWVGAPDATVAGLPDAGAIYHYHYVPSTSSVTLVQVVTENSPAVPGSAEAGDHFGAALSVDTSDAYDATDGDVAVGIPGKSVDGAAGAGAVAVLRSGSSGSGPLIGAAEETQDSPGVPGGSEAGDGFGSSVSLTSNELAVGVPGEDIGSIRDAGLVQTFSDSPPVNANGPVVRLHVGEAITQESRGVEGSSRANDRFGAAVQVGPGDNDNGRGQRPFLWIGAPGKTFGSAYSSGEVISMVLLFDGTWVAHAPVIALGSGGLPGRPQRVAHVGATLGMFAGDTQQFDNDVVGGDGVVVGVPEFGSNASNAGEVYSAGGSETNVFGPGVYRDSAGPQPQEFYGVPANNISNGRFDDG